MYRRYSEGTLEVITGPMFSGKTEELIKRINTLKYANIKTLVIKPKFDTRFSEDFIVSRNTIQFPAHNVENAEEILSLVDNSIKAVAIDEVNFFKDDIIPVIEELTAKRIRVIVAGLDQDYLRRPYGVLPKLLAMAEEVSKLKAVCMQCKLDASCSFRKVDVKKLNYIGDSDEYEARCRRCHIAGETKKQEEREQEKTQEN
ncbi:thymidine kinase [Mycoplasmopsis californica]|uniref:Thymidine kinase n=1 Tax=Mycoplasmopsis equigenitalium TaxID=114883 RepID=A0ABY5J108_9BACT|nr:thymidine kinase [Mycoplasmopsis equigenitalium]UUD36660.1 thymidine kinase [Mycoplasmopsis equigenitalium]VEU69380.1 thymidine kinase [Mycoplasmopsis californica]